MVYEPTGIMSLGTSCQVASILQHLGCRESGPIDWVDTVQDGGTAKLLLSLFSGGFIKDIMNKRWYSGPHYPTDSKGEPIPHKDIRCDPVILGNYWFVHEDLNNEIEWLKVIERYWKFKNHLESGGKFVHFVSPADILVDEGDTKSDDSWFKQLLMYLYDRRYIENILFIFSNSNKSSNTNLYIEPFNLTALQSSIMGNYYKSHEVSVKCAQEVKRELVSLCWA